MNVQHTQDSSLFLNIIHFNIHEQGGHLFCFLIIFFYSYHISANFSIVTNGNIGDDEENDDKEEDKSIDYDHYHFPLFLRLYHHFRFF